MKIDQFLEVHPDTPKKKEHQHRPHYNGKCICGNFSILSKRESDTWKGRLDEEFGELKFTDKELCEKIKVFVKKELENIEKYGNVIDANGASIRKQALADVKEIIKKWEGDGQSFTKGVLDDLKKLVDYE